MIRKPLLLLCLLSGLSAEDGVDTDIVKLLQEDMQKYSRLATSTKQNVDYMPYVVSVLKSDELVKLGIYSLGEALTLVPGVDVSVSMTGVRTPIFRGSNPFAMGQSKLIIDGVVVNDSMLGGYSQYLDMPVDIIERIEVVRGSGSLLNYVNAYAGSIHVITKANRDDEFEKEKSLFAAYGSDELMMGGFVASYVEGDLELSGDLFYQGHDQSYHVDQDRYDNSGEADMSLKNYAFGLNAQYNGLELKSRFTKTERGIGYGQSFSLSEDSSDYLEVAQNSIELAYGFELSPRIKAELSLGYFEETRELQNKVVPDGETIGPPLTLLPDGRYFLMNYKENSFTERFGLTFSNFENHTINAGVQLKQSHIKEDTAQISDDDLQSFTTKDLLSNSERNQFSLYADDLIHLSEQNSLQIGVKYDHYSDVSDQVSPRIAFVHRYDDNNIYKMMLTHSFREPSWREQYLVGKNFFQSSADMKAETVHAFEVSYIRKFAVTDSFKVNAYLLDNKDQIHAQNATQTFENSGDGKLYGYEWELNTELDDTNQMHINYSFVHGDNVSGSLTNTAHHMAKAYYIHSFSQALSFSGIIKYVGEKERVSGDDRQKVDDYTTFDLSTVYTDKANGLSVTASIKNLFDTSYHLPSPDNTYPDDFEEEGIGFFIRLGKKF